MLDKRLSKGTVEIGISDNSNGVVKESTFLTIELKYYMLRRKKVFGKAVETQRTIQSVLLS